MRRAVIKSLTREFLLSPEGDPERRVALFFSNVESEINMLCVDGDCKREDAAEQHLKKLWELRKSNDLREMTYAGGERVRYDIWLLSAAIVMSVLSEYFNLV